MPADYALCYIGVLLAPDPDDLDLEWATFAGDETDVREFEVPATDPKDAYLAIQAFDVGEWGHEILLNGEPLGGFDVPPHPGWQTWIDAFADRRLQEGTNGIAVQRDATTDDAFAVGNVVVNWHTTER